MNHVIVLLWIVNHQLVLMNVLYWLIFAKITDLYQHFVLILVGLTTGIIF
eukprot:UN00489